MHDLRDLSDVYEQLLNDDDLPGYDNVVQHNQWIYDLLDELLERAFAKSKRVSANQYHHLPTGNKRSILDLVSADTEHRD